MMLASHVLRCSFPAWYDQFEKVSAEAIVLKIPQDVLNYLRQDGSIVLPKVNHVTMKCQCGNFVDVFCSFIRSAMMMIPNRAPTTPTTTVGSTETTTRRGKMTTSCPVRTSRSSALWFATPYDALEGGSSASSTGARPVTPHGSPWGTRSHAGTSARSTSC